MTIGTKHLSLRALLVPLAFATATFLSNLHYKLKTPSKDFVDTARWTWDVQVELNVTMEECWGIITDPETYPLWYPELDVETVTGTPGSTNYTWTFRYRDVFLSVFTLGSPAFQSVFDVWEDDSNSVRRFGIYLARSSRPKVMTFREYREEYICETVQGDTNKSLMTRKTGAEPGFFGWILTVFTKRRLARILTEFIPDRLTEAVANGTLPLTS